MATTEVLLFIAGISFLIYYWCKYNYSYWKRNGIPFIEPTPIIGNTKDIFKMKKGIGLFISDFYNEPSASEAPVVGIYTFHEPALIVREPKLVKAVLIKEFNKFANRHSRSDPHGDVLGTNNLFFVRNPQWKEIRTKLTPVFTSGKIKTMYPLMLEIAAELETYLASYAKTENSFVVEIKEICALFTTDLIATIAYGIRANSLQNPNGEFRRQGRKFFEFTLPRAFDFFIAFFFPKLVTLFRVKMFSPEFSDFLRESISYVMAQREKSGTTRNDLIDILVALKKEAALEGPNSKHMAKDNDFLVAQAAVFLTAGFETSSSTMAFTLYELSRHPDVQKRLRTEINKALVAGKGTIPYENISSLEYLGMVVDEVLRLYPVLPFLDREYTRVKGEPEFTLKPYYDYTLPDGMPVYIPIFALQRDPKYWPNPDKFDPERFNSDNKKLHEPMTYLPFGTGPHNCIGNRIGLLQTKIGLIHLLKNHFVSKCEKSIEQMNFDPKALILQSVDGIYLKVVNDRMYELESGN